MCDKVDYESLSARAERGELKTIPGTALRGEAAASAGREALLEATRTDNLEHAVQVALGRPHRDQC